MKSYNQIIKDLNNPPQKKIDISKIICSQLEMPLPIVKKGIKQGQLTINNKPFYFHEIILRPDSIIRFQRIKINLTVFISDNEFDNFVKLVLVELNETSVSDMRISQKKPFCCYILSFFANNPLEVVVESGSFELDICINELESFYKDYFKDSKDSKVPRRKELVETLVNFRVESFNDLNGLVTNLTDGIFSHSLHKFLQEYSKVINKNNFQHIIAPLISNSLFSRAAIDSLIKPIHHTQHISEIGEKFIHFEAHKDLFTIYLNLIEESNPIHTRIFKKIGDYFFTLFKKECETTEIKSAEVLIKPTIRKYNFKNQEREYYDLFLVAINNGEGLARDVIISSHSDIFQFDRYNIGILKPEEQREVSISSKIAKSIAEPVLDLECNWVDGTGNKRNKTFKIAFEIQSVEIPWSELEKNKPYTIQEIEDIDKLYGRDVILQELEQNILSEKIESYKIWGQKRVGKSSIVKTLRSLFDEKEHIIVVWRSIAGLKNTDPLLTLNTLGESLCSEIFEEIDKKISSSIERERLRSIHVPAFNGSLLPLEDYIKKLKRIENKLRFIFILDEFDRINQEFFLPGTFGDTFSLNIGKGLNSLSYVGFILVGSENMHLLDRQEMNYNNFQNREVDTFDKRNEFESFRKIIVSPVLNYINYSNESIEKIYDVTNGNPYFANLICSNIFKICSKLKDNEVDIHIADEAINMIVESSQKSHFEHFWGDGITEDSNVKKERKADIRRRLLVSYSFSFFQSKSYPKKEEVIRSFKKPLEYNVESYEIENSVTEFFNRKIFYEDIDSSIRIKPSIFESWLCGPGRTLMIEGISDLEALQREKQLEAEHILKQDELQRLSDNFAFKGENIKVNTFIQYFNQFGDPFAQRRIFSIVDNLFYISKNEIVEFFRLEQKNIFKKNELAIKSGVKSPYRDSVEIYSFPETLKENIEIFESFKLISLIRTTKTLKDIRLNKDAWKQSESDDIIIFESVIDDFSSIQNDLLQFFDEKIQNEKIPIKLVSLIITSKAKADLIKSTSGFTNFKLIHFKEIEESKIKPFIDTTELFESVDEISYAFSEVRKHFHETSKESLSVLFESHSPSKSIPILWHSTSQFKSIFPNPFGITIPQKSNEEGELYRDRVYNATREFIQTINPFLINYLRNKASKDNIFGEENWFRTDYIPASCIKSITEKWTSEGCKNPKESYFDLIDYKEVIKKNKELLSTFQINDKGGGNGLEWIDTINETRRTAAHQEKPPPTLEQTLFFEQRKDEMLKRISAFKI